MDTCGYSAVVIKPKLLLLSILALVKSDTQDDLRGTYPSDLCPPMHNHWLLPHEYDCTKFYYCEYGEKWVTPRDCSPGTEFSYDEQVCVHPNFANCKLSGVPPTGTPTVAPTTQPTAAANTTATPTTTPSGSPTTAPPVKPPPELLPNGCPSDNDLHWLLPHETECDLFYYCNFGELVLRQCAAGTHFNPNIQECDWPENVNCVSSGSSTSRPPTGAPTTAPPVKPPPELLPNGCPSDTEVHWLLPHETKCYLFYYCSFGELVLRHCAPGTHFNPNIQECDWPENVNCASSGSSTSRPPTGAPTTAPPVKPPPELLPNGCPSDTDVHWLLPHETECDLFYYCNFGELVLRQCAAGTQFNPNIQECDWPENVNCASSGSSTTRPPTGAPTTAPPVKPPPELLPNGCPSDTDVHWLLPHETECDLFYYCNFGELVLRQCAAGTHFNPNIQECDWPENVNCANSGSSTSRPPTGAPTTAPPVKPPPELLPNGCPSDTDLHWLLPHETECDLFYYCNFGELVLRQCAPGTHFNPNIQECDWPENVNCASSGSSTTRPPTGAPTTAPPVQPPPELLPNGCPSDTDVHWLLPHETECDLFYYCNFGELVLRQCAAGTHFNPNIQVCDWPENVNCTSSGSSTSRPSTGAPTTAPPVKPPPELLPNGCPSDTDVHWLLPHETECDLFYYCNFGELVLRQCAAGTHFNPNIQGCDWPENVNCASSGSSTTRPPTGAPTTAPPVKPPPELLPNGCPSDNEVHWLLPHETECDLFYYCNFGELVLRQCAAGTHFNPNIQECDWPENVNCASSGSSTTRPPTGAPTTAPPVKPPPELLPNGCPSDTDVYWLLPHETKCDLFYYCSFGELVVRHCAPGTHFNPNIQECDWPENVGCVNGDEDGSGDNDLNTDICENNCNSGPWAHESKCDKYWSCVGNSVTLKACPRGLNFNPGLQTCDLKWRVRCN